MKRAALLIAIAAILIAACQPATPTPTFTPPPPPDTPAPVTTSTSTDAIDLQITIEGQAPDPLSHLLIDAGPSLTIRIDSVSVTYIEYVEQPSFLTSYEIRPSASSPVTEWEPFTREKMFDFGGIPINWVGLYVSVQYRDANGNVSPVYCDDISVEGMPPPPRL